MTDNDLALLKTICKRLDEIEEHLSEIYKRTNMLLRVDEEAAEAMVKLKMAQDQLGEALNELSDSVSPKETRTLN